MRFHAAVAVALLVLCLGAATGSALPRELTLQYTPKVRGAAGSGLSGSSGSGALLLNPAGLSFARQYLFEGLFNFSVKDSINVAGVNWVDSHIHPTLAAAVGYSYISGDDIDGAHGVNGTISVPLFSGETSMYLGTSVHYFLQQFDAEDVADYDMLTMDVGAMVSFGSMFRLGLVGYNLVSAMDSEYKPALGVGASLWWEQFSIMGDVIASFGLTPEVAEGETPGEDKVGMEYRGSLLFAPNSSFIVRGGVSHDAFDSLTQVALGFSFMIPSGVGFDFSYSANVSDFEDSVLAASIQLYPVAMFNDGR